MQPTQQQKVSHHANIITAQESLAIRKKTLLSYGQTNLPSHISVTLCVITHFLTKLSSSQSSAFVKQGIAEFLSVFKYQAVSYMQFPS